MRKKKQKARMKAAKKKESTVTATSGQLEKESSKALTNPSELSAWGDQEITSQDIIIPRLLFMQGMSDFVTDGSAKFGDIVENLGGKVIGGLNQGVEVLPFKLDRLWKVVTADGKTVSSEVIVSNPASPNYNDNLPFETEHDGEPAKRFRAFRLYVLLPSELDAGGALPYVVEFKSTALRTGKKIATQMFTRNKAAGLNPAAKTFMLSVEKIQNEKGTYVVPDASVLRDSTEEEQAVAFQWFRTLEQGANVHEED